MICLSLVGTKFKSSQSKYGLDRCVSTLRGGRIGIAITRRCKLGVLFKTDLETVLWKAIFVGSMG